MVSQLGTQGAHHDEQVLLCQNRCLRSYGGRCTGFFYQQHNNGNCGAVDRSDREHRCNGTAPKTTKTGNLDIIWDHFSRIASYTRSPRAPCDMRFLGPVFIIER